MRKLGLDPAQVLKSDLLLKIGKSYNITNVEDLYAAMGDGAVTVNKVLVRLKEDLTKDERERLQLEALQQGEGKPSSGYGKASQGVRVKGVDNILVRFSRCCNPLPGDDIVGYITRGRGVSIHRRECDNVKAHSQEEQARMVEVIWDTEVESIYPVDLEIFALDRPRLVTDVMNVVMETRTNILGINARVAKDKNTHIQLSIEIRNLGHLYNVMQKIRRVKDVTSVERVHLGGR
ncbi:GTP pyrophosphokinase [Desulfitobacterium hafniense]|uniref:GTP pyrophosphokinase n=1 Tax=Desulfitobacterium hafniense TaxID=49338 RepID=A0A098B2E7_DESHA|nr:GTP pyrophosphokinase [Desulfitobacterium hafniense]